MYKDVIGKGKKYRDWVGKHLETHRSIDYYVEIIRKGPDDLPDDNLLADQLKDIGKVHHPMYDNAMWHLLESILLNNTSNGKRYVEMAVLEDYSKRTRWSMIPEEHREKAQEKASSLETDEKDDILLKYIGTKKRFRVLRPR
ncbi:hypothetical protein ACFL96_11610 [Thermoproteota archaeon]